MPTVKQDGSGYELGHGGGGLPEGGTPYQQLVTDGDGNAKWEDRTHYITTEVGTLLEEQELAFSPTGDVYSSTLPVTLDLIEGNLYTVVFDGVSYECVCALIFGSYPFIGNPAVFGAADTGEPFMYFPAEGNLIASYDSNTSHTVGIYGVKESVHKIDEKYLHSFVPVIKSATVGQTIRVSSVDENGVPTGWEAVEQAGGLQTESVMIVNCTGSQLDATFSEMSDALNSGRAVAILAKRYDGDSNRYLFWCSYKNGEDYLRFSYLDARVKYMYCVDLSSSSEQFYWENANIIYLTSSTDVPGNGRGLILSSKTSGSTKKFEITVDDSGTISATEVTS